jgi:transposase
VVDITDKQWEAVQPCIPKRELRRPGRKGGRPWIDPRLVLDAVLWILRTGAPWGDLPRRYPPYQTCHRRFQRWVKAGVLEAILRAIAEDLRDRGKLDLTEAYVDGTHAGAKGGALWLEELAVVTPPRSWQWQTVMAFLSPWGLRVVRDMKRRSSLECLSSDLSTSCLSA